MKLKLLITIALLLSGTPLYSAAPAKQSPTEPLNYESAVKFFREALKERPLKVHQRCAVFFEGEYTNANIYSHSVIIIENSDEDFEITFYISDDRGMF